MSNYATRTYPQLSLPAGTTTGAGTVLDNGGCAANHTAFTVTSSGVSAGAVQLQGSLDNVNWANLGSALTLTASSAQSVSVSGAPFQFIRANVSTNVVGGTTQVYVASA